MNLNKSGFQDSLIIALLLFIANVEAASRFKVEPADVFVRLHDPAEFRCEVASSGGNNSRPSSLLVSWSKLDNGQRSQVAMADRVVKTWTSRARIVNGNLVINNATRELAGRYECAVPLDGLSRTAELIVIADPVKVLLEVNPKGELVEGSNVSVVCAAFGGYPSSASQFSFTIAGQPIIGTSFRVVSSPGRYAWTNASVDRLLVADDNAATVKCSVTNPLTNITLSAVTKLNVYYSPKMMAKGGIRRVIENGSLSLECAASANPDNITYEWRVPDALSSLCVGRGSADRKAAASCNSRVLRLPKVDRVASGTFTCFASNGFHRNRKAELRWNVAALYPPMLILQDKYIFRENAAMMLTCFDSVLAMESVTSIDEVQWLFQGALIPSQNEPVLSKLATRDAAGRYECQLRVRLIPTDGDGQPETRVLRKSAQVTIHYLPGKPWMQRPESNSIAVKVNLGDPLRLTCVLPRDEIGEPPGSIEWTNSISNFSRTLAHGNTLEISRTNFTHEAIYRCTPVNSVGRGPYTSVNVKIIGARFEKQLPPRISKRAKDSLAGYQPLALECALCIQPLMNFVWSHNGVRIDPNDRRRFNITTEYSVSDDALCRTRVLSVLRFVGTSRPALYGLLMRDYGQYTCAVTLDDEPIANSSTFIDIRHPPIVDRGRRFFHAKPNQSVTLECLAHGNPLPEVTWQKSNQAIRAFETDLEGPYSKRARLHLERVTEDSFGAYACVVQNEEGIDNGSIILRRTGPPGMMSNVRVTETTWESIQLEWEAEDDGGAPLSFSLIYSEQDFATGEKKLNATSEKRAVIWPLASNRKYSFRVIPYNIHGTGPTASLLAQTNSLVMPQLDKPIYLENSKMLSVRSILPNDATNTSYCLLIEFLFNGKSEGSGWQPISHCLAWQVSQDRLPVEIPGWMLQAGSTGGLRVSLCVSHRMEICDTPVTILTYSSAASAAEFAPSWILYAVAVACSTIVMSLSGSLVLYCYCRRRRVTRKNKRRVEDSNGKYSYMKADTQVDLMLGTADDIVDEQFTTLSSSRLNRPSPRFDARRSTYMCIDTADLHPALNDSMYRHAADLQLSSADTSDTSVCMLPRDVQHRVDDASAKSLRPGDSNYVPIHGHSGFNLTCNQHQSLQIAMACNCVEMGALSDRHSRSSSQNGNCNGTALTMETAPSIDKRCGALSNTTVIHPDLDHEQYKFMAKCGTMKAGQPQSLQDAELCMRSNLYRKSPTDQAFEMIV